MAIQWITWKKAKAFYLSIHLLNKPFLSRAPALNLSLKAIRRYDWLKASLYDSFEPIIIVIIECSPALYVMHWFWPQRYWCHSAMGEVPLKDELKRRMLLRFYFRYPRLCPHVLCLTSVASLTTHKKHFSKYCPCLVEHGLMISSHYCPGPEEQGGGGSVGVYVSGNLYGHWLPDWYSNWRSLVKCLKGSVLSWSPRGTLWKVITFTEEDKTDALYTCCVA